MSQLPINNEKLINMVYFLLIILKYFSLKLREITIV